MNEKEKMQFGQWYDANNDFELLKERDKAKDLCFDYNQCLPSDNSNKNRVLMELFGYLLPNNLEIIQPFYCDYGKNIKLGENVFINNQCYFMDGGEITIGNNVFIGPNCGFYTAIHPLTYKQRNEGLEKALPIIIEDNVWISANVVILPGVTIKQGSVIGAGSVVTKDIEENVLAYGNPCVIRKRISQED